MTQCTPKRWMKLAKTAVAIMAVSAVSLTLAGCGGGGPAGGSEGKATVGSNWDDVVAKANDEGRVVIYMSLPGTEEAIKKGFAEEYPDIEVQTVRLASADLLARLDHEKGAKADGADVVLHADTGWFKDNESELVTQSGPSIPKYWTNSGQVFGDNKYVTTDYVPCQIAINTETLKKAGAHPINGFEDLAQPALANGLIGLTTPSVATSNAQFWYFVYKALGEGYLKDLAALKPSLYSHSTTEFTQSLAAGSHAAGTYSLPSLTDPLKEQGAPIETVSPEPAVVIPHRMGVPSWSHRANAGLVLADWLLSPAGQIAISGRGGTLSPLSPDSFESAPDAMEPVPEDVEVADGIMTDEQTKFIDDVWTPLFGG